MERQQLNQSQYKQLLMQKTENQKVVIILISREYDMLIKYLQAVILLI